MKKILFAAIAIFSMIFNAGARSADSSGNHTGFRRVIEMPGKSANDLMKLVERYCKGQKEDFLVSFGTKDPAWVRDRIKWSEGEYTAGFFSTDTKNHRVHAVLHNAFRGPGPILFLSVRSNVLIECHNNEIIITVDGRNYHHSGLGTTPKKEDICRDSACCPSTGELAGLIRCNNIPQVTRFLDWYDRSIDNFLEAIEVDLSSKEEADW
jgi:hypothetical protein